MFIRDKPEKTGKPGNPDRLQPVTVNKSGYPDNPQETEKPECPEFSHLHLIYSFDFRVILMCCREVFFRFKIPISSPGQLSWLTLMGRMIPPWMIVKKRVRSEKLLTLRSR
jgi:hypothetical protein